MFLFMSVVFCISLFIVFAGLRRQLSKNEQNKTVQHGASAEYTKSSSSKSQLGGQRIDLRKRFKIEYTNEKGEVSDREIQAHFLYYGQNGKCLLNAQCSLRNENRSFRIDRIISLVDLQTGEEIQGNFQSYLENIGTKNQAS